MIHLLKVEALQIGDITGYMEREYLTRSIPMML
jgi:hypothetical protein